MAARARIGADTLCDEGCSAVGGVNMSGHADETSLFTYEKISKLNDLEVMVFNYVVSHAHEVMDETIRELADQVHVSTTSIMRFCAKLGCSGFCEFKFRLRRFIEEGQALPPEDDNLAVAMDFFERVRTGGLNDDIGRAAKVIASKEFVFFVGMGTSGTMGKYGARYLSNLGKNAFYLDDPFYPTDRGSYRETVVVALSVSGEQRFLYRQIEGLKRCGATVISITNTRQCTLAEISDLNIAYYIPMLVLPGLYNVTTSLPVIYILETLAHDVQRFSGVLPQDIGRSELARDARGFEDGPSLMSLL